jgi:crotonobetainyl-CoA:carnitine CoA-transferase CaiB-like acyl-CoA transferase
VDGWVTVGAAQQNFWERLCGLLGAPELPRDPRFATNADRVRNNDELVGLLQDRFRQKDSAHWLAEMEQAGIPCGPVLAYDEILTDPHILAREMVVETSHPKTGPFKTLGVTAKLSDTPGSIRAPAPRLGEHTAEALAARAAAE